MEALETQLLAVTGLLGEVSALQEQAAQLIAEADPPNGWLLEPSQADVEVSYAEERLPHFQSSVSDSFGVRMCSGST